MQTQIENFLNKLQVLAVELGYYPKFSCDSRLVEKGSVFIALKGSFTDGHYFIDEVMAKGASFCLVSSNYEKNEPYLFKVDDVLTFVKQVASYKIQLYKPITIGITGSCGKTSTKYYLAHLLEEKFRVFASCGNFNSQIGLPLALLSLEQKYQVAVLEMGMSHRGDITKLCTLFPLDYAIITSIGLAHAENFEDKDIGIACAKGEILLNHPKAFYNQRTDDYLPFKDYDHKTVIHTSGISLFDQQTCFLINNQSVGPCYLHIDAPHLLENLHLAIACAKELGVTNEAIIKAAQELRAEKGRLAIVKKNQITFIDDSYNASPSSMKAAITYLKQQQGQRKIALIGAMRELGSITNQEHLNLYHDLKEGIDYIFFVGDETRALHQKLDKSSRFINSIDELVLCLKTFLTPHDVVLIKGSHSTHLHTVLDKL